MTTSRFNPNHFLKISIAKLVFLSICTFFFNELDSQKNLKDSIVYRDTLKLHSSNQDIKSKISYQADDSIIFDVKSRTMHLYNQSVVDYSDIHIDAYFINYNWTTGLLSAFQNKINEDSILGKPYLKQDGKDYYTEKVLYNFKSQKGKVYNIITKEPESQALLHGKEVKKDSLGNWFISKAKFTTCDLEHPHFYFNSNKIKLTNKKTIVTGPANIVIADIPTPIYLPFGIYPTQSGRRSGIILPKQYGFNPMFNLQDMGYYLGINDYWDAQATADVYFNGSYEFEVRSRYTKKYAYNGEFKIMTNRIFLGDNDNPKLTASTPTNYVFNWTHTQNPKAHPTFNFNSSLQYMTSGAYNNSITLDPRRINSQISSNLNITKRFRYSPVYITAGVNYTQNLAANTVSGQLPTFRVNYSGNLLKTNGSSPMNISLNYSTEAISRFDNVADSNIWNGNLFNQMKMGLYSQFNFNVTGYKLFKQINFVPNFSYRDRAYFKRISYYNRDTFIDTLNENGLYTVRDFDGGVNMSTNIIGIFPVSNKGWLRGIRHQLTPSLNFNVSPSFNGDFWGYYNSFIDKKNTSKSYYLYDGPDYSKPNNFANAVLSFGISNNFEGKFRNRKDTILGAQKMMLLDVLSIGGNYSLTKDSFKMSNLGVQFSNSTLKFLTFSGSIVLDPYKYENGSIIDKYKLIEGDGLFRVNNINGSMSLNLSSNNIKSRILNSKKGTEIERNFLYQNYHHFYDFNNPWTINMSFNMNIKNDISTKTRQDTSILSASLNLNRFDFLLTKNWKLGISSGYDFNQNKLGITTISAIRDMHCWEFRVNYTPISSYGQSYSIEIAPKASMLQDLKLTKNKPVIDNYF